MGKESRKLSPAELKRKESFEQKASQLENQGYVKKELTVSVLMANVLAVIIMLPLVFLLSYVYMEVNKEGITVQFGLKGALLFIITAFALIVVHEGIHGLTWGSMAKSRFHAIEFGVIWSMLTPYCTCKEELKKKQYFIGAVMPTILVGILPAVLGIVFHQAFLFLLGQLMIFGGGGDAIIVLKLLLHKEQGKDCIYLDHPYECGVVAFERA